LRDEFYFGLSLGDKSLLIGALERASDQTILGLHRVKLSSCSVGLYVSALDSELEYAEAFLVIGLCLGEGLGSGSEARRLQHFEDLF
jgi:hypothetical protein